jgi:DNA-directed RNA polymerase specialized sigma24 family protein
MELRDEVTPWLTRLAGGDQEAAQIVWEQYFDRMVNLARRKLEGMPRRVADEEDVALSAMKSFCRGAVGGRFPKLQDSADLWKLLMTITARKACAQRRRHMAAMRGGGGVRGESVFARRDEPDDAAGGIGEVLGQEPTPELANMLVEDAQRMLEALGDDVLRRVALMALEGHSTEEIADALGCVRRTVERKLERIRDKWSRQGSG